MRLLVHDRVADLARCDQRQQSESNRHCDEAQRAVGGGVEHAPRQAALACRDRRHDDDHHADEVRCDQRGGVAVAIGPP